MRQVWLVARSVLVEAVRRKEIYAVILVSLLIIGCVVLIDFFELDGIAKFYREVALKVMSAATAGTTIILAARQLPREFENRTIYPLLAKPVSRWKFMAGKLLGVLLSAIFCLAMFMAVFIAGSLYLGAALPWVLLVQFFYLQILMMLILASLAFWLSLLLNLDAAITVGLIFYATSAIITSASSFLYEWMTGFGQTAVTILTFILPQLTLLDLSAKTVHSEYWPPLSAVVIGQLTLYAAVFIALYIGLSMLSFRRRSL